MTDLAGAHPIPLTRLVILVLWSVFGIGTRWVPVCASMLLIVSSGLFLALPPVKPVVRVQFTQATVPLALIGLASPAVLTWNTALSHSLTLASFVVLLVAAMHGCSSKSVLRSTLLVAALLILSFQGIMGVAMAFPFVVVFSVLLVLGKTDGFSRKGKAILWSGLTLYVAYGLSAASLVLAKNKLPADSYGGETLSVGAALSTSLQFMTAAFGDLGKRLWPASGMVVAVLYLLSVAALVRAWKVRRIGIQQMLICLAAISSIPIAGLLVGVGRSFQGGFTPWYVMLGACSVLAFHISWGDAFASRIAAFLQVCLFSVMCAIAVWTWGEGLHKLREYRAAQADLYDDIRSKLPVSALASRNGVGLSAHTLELLRREGPAPFNSIRLDPHFEETDIGLDIGQGHLSRRREDAWVTEGEGSFVVFDMARSAHVAAVRVEYGIEFPGKGMTMRCVFLESGNAPIFGRVGEVSRSEYFWRDTDKRERESLFWIDRAIKCFAIYPCDKPCEISFHRVTILTGSDNANPPRAVDGRESSARNNGMFHEMAASR